MITTIDFFDETTGTWQAVDAVYPIQFTQRLDRELDSGEFNSLGDDRKKAYSIIRIVIGDTADSADTFYFYANSSQKWQPSEVNQNGLRLIEPTKVLQGRFIDGLSVVQPITGTQKTLLEVVNRILAVTPLRVEGEEQEFVLTTDSEIVDILQNTSSPEFQWSSQTSLWEVLCDIGSYIDAIPRLTFNTTTNALNIITFDLVNQQKEQILELGYYGKLTNFDESQYCTFLESNVSNLTTANEFSGALIYPSDSAYITPRTEEIRLTSQNCQIITGKSISQLSRLLMDATPIRARYAYENNTLDKGAVEVNLKTGMTDEGDKIDDIITQDSIDLTYYTKEYDDWTTLDYLLQSEVGADETGTELSKNNTFYWARYTDKVTLLNTTFAIGVTGLFSKSVFRYLIECWAKQYGSKIFPQTITARNPSIAGSPFRTYYFEGVSVQEGEFNDPREYQFQVQFIPIEEENKVRAPKSDMPKTLDYVQPMNQRAEVNNAGAYGLNMQGMVNRLGVDLMTAPVQYVSWSEIHKIGDVYQENGEEYIVTSVDYTIKSAETVLCVYSLSKDWNYLSQFFGLEKKFRSWEIPRQIIQRNLYRSDFCIVTPTLPQDASNTSALTLAGITAIADVFRSSDFAVPVGNSWLFKPELVIQSASVIPASSFGFGNSIFLFAKTKDNMSAGVYISKSNDGNDYCRDKFYCNDDGTMETCTWEFAREIQSAVPDSLPHAVITDTILLRQNAPSEVLVTLADLHVQKESTECLAMNYQLFFIAENPTTVISPNLAGNNSIVSYLPPREWTVWGLTKKLPKMAKDVTSAYGVELANSVSVGVYTPSGYVDVSVGTIGNDYIGWCITGDGKILLTQYRDCDGTLPETLYFVFKHKK